jgi:hypothetical protein
VYHPSDINPLVDRMIELMIERDMGYHGYLPYGSGSASGFYDSSATAMTDPEYSVTPGYVPGPGHATGTVLVAEGFQELCGRSEFDPSVQVYQHWEAAVTELFSPYIMMPSYWDFTSLDWTMKDACELLATEPVVSTEGEIEYGGNDALISALTTGDGSLALLQGVAMNTFRTGYWGQVEPTSQRYHLVARLIWILVVAERDLWKNAWNDLKKISDDIVDCLETRASVQIPFTAIGTIASLASKIPGPQAGIIGVVGTVSGVLGKLQGDGGEERDRPFDFGGTAAECFTEMQDALSALNDDIAAQERAIASQATTLTAELGDPDYVIARPDAILDAADPDAILPEGSRLSVEPTTLDLLADDVLGTIASALRGGADELSLPGHEQTFWRNGVGEGETGPFEAIVGLNEALVGLINTAGTTLDQVAEVLRVVKRVFVETDEAVAGELAALTP